VATVSVDAPRVVVVAGVMDGAHPGEVFAFRRAVGQREAGSWEFPGGKLEPGERPEEGLARELHEELALNVVVGNRLWSGCEGQIEVTFYRVNRGEQIPCMSVHDAMRSVSADAPPELAWASVDREFVRHLVHLSRGADWRLRQ
jgi:8-oxo-dGTP diphosphatase